MADIYGQVGTVLTLGASGGEVVLHEEKKEESDVKDGTESSEALAQEKDNYRYPLTLSTKYPAYIIFRAIKVDGADFSEFLGDIGRGPGKALLAISPAATAYTGVAERAYEKTTSDDTDKSEADDELTEEEKGGILSGLSKAGKALKSFENLEGGVAIGSVMLPLQRSLQFNDQVTYNVANLGVAGSAAGALLQGKNPFAGALTAGGQVSKAAAGIVSQSIAQNAVSAVAGAIGGKLGGVTGGVLGFGAGGGIGEGVGAAIKNASRIATNPNQRTLFENVGMRDFAFSFKMVANNEKEAIEIKNIVKFFRRELYPEPIVTSTGVSLAYEFPNMFEIDIKNFVGEAPAPKIQRCYLASVQTNYNATASSMHADGNFIEVDITLSFKEISALNKKKVRDEDY